MTRENEVEPAPAEAVLCPRATLQENSEDRGTLRPGETSSRSYTMPSTFNSRLRKRQLQPAPGDLLVVQNFLNSADLRAGTDLWKTPAALAGWAVEKRLLSGRMEFTEEDLRRAVEVREGLRRALVTHSAATAQALEEVIGPISLRVRIESGVRLHFEAEGSGLELMLGSLLTLVAAAQAAGEWRRFKVCANKECRTAFYDRSYNLSARWCRPSCGNRISSHGRKRRSQARPISQSRAF